MKKILASIIMSALIAGFTIATQAQTQPASPSPQLPAIPAPSIPAAPQVQTPAAVEHIRKERHPEIRRAQHALLNAKNDLDNATHDYSGHRGKALEHIEAAQEELRQALQSVGRK